MSKYDFQQLNKKIDSAKLPACLRDLPKELVYVCVCIFLIIINQLKQQVAIFGCGNNNQQDRGQKRLTKECCI